MELGGTDMLVVGDVAGVSTIDEVDTVGRVVLGPVTTEIVDVVVGGNEVELRVCWVAGGIAGGAVPQSVAVIVMVTVVSRAPSSRAASLSKTVALATDPAMTAAAARLRIETMMNDLIVDIFQRDEESIQV